MKSAISISDYEKYISDCLQNSKSLAGLLLQKFHFEDGDASLILANDSDAEKYQSLKYGGVTSLSGSQAKLASIIQSYLSTPNACAIFENTLAKPTDLSLQKQKENIILYDDEVYYWLKSGSYSLEQVTAFLKMPRYSFAGIGILTRAEPVADPLALTMADLGKFVENLYGIVVSVFDGEGYMLWKKTR